MKKTVLIILLTLVSLTLGALYLVERNQKAEPPDESQAKASLTVSGRTDRLELLEKKLQERELELARLRRRLTTEHGEDDVTVVDVPGAGGDDEDAGDVGVGNIATNIAQGLAGVIQQALQSALSGSNGFDGATFGELAGGDFGMPSSQRRLAVYEDLIKSLGLDEEKAAAFRELLGKQNSGISIKVMGQDGNLSRELDGILGGLGGSQDEAIRELLGDDDYAKYKNFAETESARTMVNEFEDSLTADNLAISAEQRTDLIELFQSVRMADQEGAADLNDGLSFSLDGERPLDEKVDGSLDSLVARYDALARDADSVLDDTQSEQLRAYLDQKLEQKEMEGDLARRLLGNVSVEGLPNAAVQGSVRVMGPMSVGVISSSSEETLPKGENGQAQQIQINMGGNKGE